MSQLADMFRETVVYYYDVQAGEMRGELLLLHYATRARALVQIRKLSIHARCALQLVSVTENCTKAS